MSLLLPEMFEFAAPPRTGVHWFVKACQEAGLETFPDARHAVGASFLRWPEDTKKAILRVSLVRHPCDWLRSVFGSFNVHRATENIGLARFLHREFYDSPHEGFDEFVSWYLETKLGLIGRIFDSYHTDSRLRLEDMPWALVELLESFGVEQEGLDRVIDLPLQMRAPFRSRWQSGLREQVLESEAGLCQDLDYY